MSGRTAAYKVAYKNAKRNRKRTIFLVLLVAVPVALGVVVAGMVRASTFTAEERAQLQFGAGDARIEFFAPEPGVADWIYRTLDELDAGVETTEFREAGIRLEDFQFALITDLDMNSSLTKGMLVHIGGELPDTEDEVGLSPIVMENLDVSVGDQVDFEEYGTGPLTVVGVVSHPLTQGEGVILMAPGALTSAAGDVDLGGTSVLIGGSGAGAVGEQLHEQWWSTGREQFWPQPAVTPRPAEISFLADEIYLLLTESEIKELVEIARSTPPDEDPSLVVQDTAIEMAYGSGREFSQLAQLNVETRAAWANQMSLEDNPSLLSTGASALLLVEVAFITGAAFAAGTRRRLREIGLMGAQGASQDHIKTTVLGEGLTIGLIGSAAGAGLGILVLLVGRPILHRFVSRLVTGVGVGLLDVAGPMAVALVSVLIAVWIPAKTASRVPTTTALQGRMPASSPRPWVVPIGLGSAGLGALIITVALASTSNFSGFLVGVGSVLVVGGVAMLASPILAGVTKMSDLVPATGRLVLRDSGRNRTRSSVAVAAIMVILLLPVIYLTMAATSAERDLIYGLPSPEGQIVVTGQYDQALNGPRGVTDQDLASLAAVIPLDRMVTFEGLGLRLNTKEALETETDFPTGFGGSSAWPAAVGSVDLAEALGHNGVMASLADGEIVVLGVEDKDTYVELNNQNYEAVEYAVPVVRFAMPRVLIPEQLASSEFGEESRGTMALAFPEEPVTEQQWREVWITLNLEINGGNLGLSDAAIYAIAMSATLVVVLIVVALVTAVSAAEVDEEIRTIVAVGAAGNYRRRFLGLLTGYQTLIATALAIPLGLGLVKVFSVASDGFYIGVFGGVSTQFMAVPWWQLATLALAMPLIVGLLTLVSVRSAPVTPPRRAT